MKVDFFKQGATDVFLEVEVPPQRADKFESAYLNIAGEPAVLGTGYQHQPNKWGAEYRIYFNQESDMFDDFANLGIDVEQGARPYRETRKYRVNNEAFFWALVKAGYRLGAN